AVPPRLGGHLAGLGGVHRERLLDQHVLACPQGEERVAVVPGDCRRARKGWRGHGGATAGRNPLCFPPRPSWPATRTRRWRGCASVSPPAGFRRWVPGWSPAT